MASDAARVVTSVLAGHVSTPILRAELLNWKADLERELGRLVLRLHGLRQWVHWVAGLGVTPGHWAHREPAPHSKPIVA